MNPLYRLFLFCLLMALLPVSCQSVRQKRILAYEQLSELEQKGIILVRLKQMANKLKAIEEAGKGERAEKLEGEVLNRQARMLTMFRAHFTFCPVYFFFADQSGALRDGHWDRVTFLDVEGDYVDGDSLYGRPYLVAEFGRVYETQILESNPEGEERFSAGMAGKDGLVLKDSNFVQLEDPYPYKFFQWKPEKAVMAMDQSLHDYLRKQEDKKYMMQYLLEQSKNTD